MNNCKEHAGDEFKATESDSANEDRENDEEEAEERHMDPMSTLDRSWIIEESSEMRSVSVCEYSTNSKHNYRLIIQNCTNYLLGSVHELATTL